MLYTANNAFSLHLFCLSLVNGVWCNEDVGHCGSGSFWACRLSFGLLCYTLSAHESISSTEISFNLGAQKGRAAPGTPGGSALSFISCRMEGRGGLRTMKVRRNKNKAEIYTLPALEQQVCRHGAVRFGQQGFGTWALAWR